MKDYVTGLLQRYRRAGVLLDSNILLLYFVGSFDPKQISRFKRTKQFTEEDYYTLLSVLGYFEKIVSTPNILTEVSNLSGQFAEPLKLLYFDKFASGIALIDERYLPSANISQIQGFRRFGITDAGIIHLARDTLILTDDFRLSQYLQSKNVDVLNFNHIRTFNWE